MTALAGPSDAELDALVAAVLHRYHYDFRGYARASLRRRVAHAVAQMGAASVDELAARVTDDPAEFSRLLGHLTVQVSEMFRDPGFFRALRDEVAPRLATWPTVRAWVAGCSTGEELYSLAIVLHEAGLLERSLLYATDINPGSLERARSGVYPVDRVRRFSDAYARAGGRGSLTDYFTAAYGAAAFHPWLRERAVFADHSLATDAVFAEVQLVLCRNVLIYFDLPLQERALTLFHDALPRGGFLGLGARESLLRSRHAAGFTEFDRAQRIYRRR